MIMIPKADMQKWIGRFGGLHISRRTASMTLLLIFAASVCFIYRLDPKRLFGQYQDDTLYMGAALALAEDRGYLIPSLPNTPVQTKYPVFFPWILSFVWRWNPDFPSNLDQAVALSAFFACFALWACYRLVRCLGAGRGLSLAITAYCGLHPVFLQISSRIMTDVPMMGLAILSLVLLEASVRKQAPRWLPALSGIIMAAAVLTRLVAVAFLLAGVGFALYRRGHRAVIAFAGCSVPIVCIVLLLQGNNEPLDAWAAAGDAGFRQTWLFYTSYGDFWKLSVPDLESFLSMLSQNTIIYLLTPASYFLFLGTGHEGWVVALFAHAAVTFAVFHGLFRHGKANGWSSLHLAVPLYSAVLLIWSHGGYMLRFGLPLLPVFAFGLWFEARSVVAGIAESLRRPKSPLLDRVVAAGFALAILFFSIRGATGYWQRNNDIASQSAQRARVSREEQELHTWIRDHTEESARFISCDDGHLYLRTRRQAIYPIIFSQEVAYANDSDARDRDLAHVLDTARHVEARYWVSSSRDFNWLSGGDAVRAKIEEVLTGQPLLFESSAGTFRVHDLQGLSFK